MLIVPEAPDPGNADRVSWLKAAFLAVGAEPVVSAPVVPLRMASFVGPLGFWGLKDWREKYRHETARADLVIFVMDEARGSDFGGPALNIVQEAAELRGIPVILASGAVELASSALGNSGVAGGYEIAGPDQAAQVATTWMAKSSEGVSGD